MKIPAGDIREYLWPGRRENNAGIDCSIPAGVIWGGLEPPTDCLEGSCSIQLSYQTDLVV